MPEPLLLIIQCKGCGLWVQAQDGQHPNAASILRCGCCTAEHDHDEAAERAQVPCRPINITLISPIELQLGVGQPRSDVFSDAMTVNAGARPAGFTQAINQTGVPERVVPGEVIQEG